MEWLRTVHLLIALVIPALLGRGVAADPRRARHLPARGVRLCLADPAAALRSAADGGAAAGLAQWPERPL